MGKHEGAVKERPREQEDNYRAFLRDNVEILGDIEKDRSKETGEDMLKRIEKEGQGGEKKEKAA